MADLTVTAANVIGSGTIEDGTAGVALTAGKVVAKDATGVIVLADSNSATALIRQALGITLNAAAVGQPVAYQKGGDITIGATLTTGANYFLSDTPGGICPDADVGAGEYVSQLGIAISTTALRLNIRNSGVSR